MIKRNPRHSESMLQDVYTLYENGLTYSQIADKLGLPSRCSVAGIINRLLVKKPFMRRGATVMIRNKKPIHRMKMFAESPVKLRE